MDKNTLDNIVDYPIKALHAIGTDPCVVQLLTDNPTIDMGSPEADDVFSKYLFDYEYVDGTTTEAAAYICVEADMVKPQTSTVNEMRLYVTVVCHKQYMKIDHQKFKGIAGNRKNNLSRYVNALLDESDIFGIGKLKLLSARTIPAPAGFSAREMTYTVPAFSKKGLDA